MAVGSLYSVATSTAAIGNSVPKTLIVITGGATAVTSIERLYVGQSTQDTSENVDVKFQRASAAGTSTAFTVAKMSNLAGATAATLGVNATVEPTYTSNTILINQAFNVLSGFLWTPGSDDEVITIPPSGIAGLCLITALASSATLDYGMIYREYG
jgi:hypothetical protein